MEHPASLHGSSTTPSSWWSLVFLLIAGHHLLARAQGARRAARAAFRSTTTAKERPQCRPRSRRTPSPAAMTTGHEWDGVQGAQHAAAEMVALRAVCHHRWRRRLCACCIRRCPRVTGYFHGLLGYSQRKTVDADVAAVAAQRAGAMATHPGAVVRRHPQGPAASGSGGDRRAHHLRQQLPALPRRRRRRAAGLSRAGRRRLALGRHAGGDPADRHPRHPQRRSGRARNSMMPRFGVDGMLKPEQIQQVADYVMTLFGKPEAGVGRGRWQDPVRRQLRRLSRRRRRGQPRVRRAPPRRAHPSARRRRARTWWPRSPIRAWA